MAKQRKKDWSKITTPEEMATLVEIHQSLLIDDEILRVVPRLRPQLLNTTEGQLLLTVCLYHMMKKRQQPGGAWDAPLALLRGLSSPSPVVQFYILNYRFLGKRNGGALYGDLKELYEQICVCAERCEDAVRHQLLGFIEYNWGRYLFESKHIEQAMQHYAIATTNRRDYYLAVRAHVDPAVITAAATQLWKIADEYPKRFPTESRLIDADLFDEVAATARKEFSAVK